MTLHHSWIEERNRHSEKIEPSIVEGADTDPLGLLLPMQACLVLLLRKQRRLCRQQVVFLSRERQWLGPPRLLLVPMQGLLPSCCSREADETLNPRSVPNRRIVVSRVEPERIFVRGATAFY